MRAKNNDCPETLLAAVDAPTAKGIVGNAVSVVEEERPFQTPLLAHSRHSKQSSSYYKVVVFIDPLQGLYYLTFTKYHPQ